MVKSCAGNGADKDLKAELDYVREECEAAQAKGKELQIKKNAAEARLVTPVHHIRAPTTCSANTALLSHCPKVLLASALTSAGT